MYVFWRQGPMSPYSICILQIDEWTKKRYCQYLTPKGTMPKVMDGKFINKIWRVTQTLKIWSSYSNISGHRKRWKIIPACIWWSTWKERNLRCHQNKSNTIQKMKMNCLVLFHFWCKQEYMEVLESVVNVLGSLLMLS